MDISTAISTKRNLSECLRYCDFINVVSTYTVLKILKLSSFRKGHKRLIFSLSGFTSCW